MEGAELELQWLPLEGLSLRASGTYLNSKVTDAPNGGYDGVNSIPITTVFRISILARLGPSFLRVCGGEFRGDFGIGLSG